MNIIILADKFQKRMKSKGCVGLMPFEKKNILHHQYIVLQSLFPNSNIIYIYGFDHKRFVKFYNKNKKNYPKLNTIHNIEHEEYNSVYSLSLVKQYLNDDCMILFGDHIIKHHMFDKFKPSVFSQVFISKCIKNHLGCILRNNQICNIAYDLDNYLSEIYFISKRDIDAFKNLVCKKPYYNCFVFEIINKMIDFDCPIFSYNIPSIKYAHN